MNELISVTYNNDRPTVLGRDLHEKLEVKSRYNDWFARMAEYGFEENQDYVAVTQKRVTAQGNGTVYTDHQLTLDMAKQICMLQRTDIGRKYREYFLEIERRWNDPQAVMARSLLYANRQLATVTGQLEEANATIAQLAPKAAYYDAVAASDGDKSFRETAKMFGVPEKKFIAFLIDCGYVYRDARGTLIPYADHMKRGQFTVREVVINGVETLRSASQTKITPKGRQVIWRRMANAGLIPMQF